MSGKGNGAVPRLDRREAAAEGRAQGLDVGWTVFGYLIAGMLAYGGIGWLIGRAVHVALLFPGRHADRPGDLDRLHHLPLRHARSGNAASPEGDDR